VVFRYVHGRCTLHRPLWSWDPASPGRHLLCRDLAHPQPLDRDRHAIANLVTNFGDIRSLTTENERLRTENERLASQVARLQEDTARLGDLERLLDVKQALADQTFLTGRVVASEPNNLRQVIAIDRASRTGEDRDAGANGGQSPRRNCDKGRLESRLDHPGDRYR